jgi:hypothetical protein
MGTFAYAGGTKLLTGATGTGAGSTFNVFGKLSEHNQRTFQATVTGTGAVTATVLIQVSNDGTNFLTLGTITLSGTTSASDGFASNAPWVHVRANVSAISGTSAAVTVVMGV